jgi:uncharacterized protein (DUF433 family)
MRSPRYSGEEHALSHFDYHKHLHSDPKISGGTPVFSGTRVPLRVVLNSLAEGATLDEVRRSFPTLTEDHLRAAVAFAAASAAEDIPTPPPPFREAV